MSEENANESAGKESASVKAPQRYWWVVLVVVPLAIAAMPLLRGCHGEGESGDNMSTKGKQSPVIKNAKKVEINYDK